LHSSILELSRKKAIFDGMKQGMYFFICWLCVTPYLLAQSFDEELSVKKMVKDLEVFKDLRIKANSGIYKYRTKEEIDSTYRWAFDEIQKSKTFGDFFNIVCALTDFEGSLHNDTSLPKEVHNLIRKEEKGYFPFPIKLVEGKTVFNIAEKDIPVGAEIISINNRSLDEIIPNLYKYYTTDGLNITGKSIGINYHFSKYYRLHYGLEDSFEVKYREHKSNDVQQTIFESVGYIDYYKNVKNRYSKPFDKPNYAKHGELGENGNYGYKKLNDSTGLLTVNSFSIGGNGSAPEHLEYVEFLDRTFGKMKMDGIKNLVVDVRYNGGGTDPNDLVTYSYLTQRNFSENKQAWISFRKIPYLKLNADSNLPYFIKILGVGRYNKQFRKAFPKTQDGGYYQDDTSSDHKVRVPNKNAFTGQIYLLISPRIASAGSLFAAMVAGNPNTTVIGEETMGGYYGHNGHVPLSYKLPKSKIETSFSVVNLEQDVPEKANQIYERGIIPDHIVPQTYKDYLNQTDTQMNFVLELLKR